MFLRWKTHHVTHVCRYESVERKTRERRNMKLSRARSAGGIAIITPCLPYARGRGGEGGYIYFWLQSINRTRLKYGSGRTWCSSITGGGAMFIYVYTVAGLREEKTFLLSAPRYRVR